MLDVGRPIGWNGSISTRIVHAIVRSTAQWVSPGRDLPPHRGTITHVAIEGTARLGPRSGLRLAPRARQSAGGALGIAADRAGRAVQPRGWGDRGPGRRGLPAGAPVHVQPRAGRLAPLP